RTSTTSARWRSTRSGCVRTRASSSSTTTSDPARGPYSALRAAAGWRPGGGAPVWWGVPGVGRPTGAVLHGRAPGRLGSTAGPAPAVAGRAAVRGPWLAGRAEFEGGDARDDEDDADDLDPGEGVAEEHGADDRDEGDAQRRPDAVGHADAHAEFEDLGEQGERDPVAGERDEGRHETGEPVGEPE